MVDFISEKLAKGSWKTHATIIAIYVAITTPLTWYLCLYSREMNALVDALTNTSNVVALGYAVYIYYLYDKTKTEALNKAREKGIEVPNMDEALGIVYGKFKQLDNWLEENKPALQKLQAKAKDIDLTEMLSSLEELSQVAKSMQEHGFNKERFEKLFILFEKVDLDKVIAVVETWNKTAQSNVGLPPNVTVPEEWKPEPLPIDENGKTATETEQPTPKENEDTSTNGLPPLQRRRPPVKR